MSENGEIYTAVKNFTLPPALTALTNSNSAKNTDEQLACLGENGQIWVSYALIKWTE